MVFENGTCYEFLEEYREVLAEAPDGYEQMEPLAAEPFSHDYNLRHIEYLIGHYDKCLHQLVFIEAVDIVCDWILKDQYFMV